MLLICGYISPDIVGVSTITFATTRPVMLNLSLADFIGSVASYLTLLNTNIFFIHILKCMVLIKHVYMLGDVCSPDRDCLSSMLI